MRLRYTHAHSERATVCVCGWRRRSEVFDFYIVCVGKETEVEERLPGSAIASEDSTNKEASKRFMLSRKRVCVPAASSSFFLLPVITPHSS